MEALQDGAELEDFRPNVSQRWLSRHHQSGAVGCSAFETNLKHRSEGRKQCPRRDGCLQSPATTHGSSATEAFLRASSPWEKEGQQPCPAQGGPVRIYGFSRTAGLLALRNKTECDLTVVPHILPFLKTGRVFFQVSQTSSGHRVSKLMDHSLTMVSLSTLRCVLQAAIRFGLWEQQDKSITEYLDLSPTFSMSCSVKQQSGLLLAAALPAPEAL